MAADPMVRADRLLRDWGLSEDGLQCPASTFTEDMIPGGWRRLYDVYWSR